MTRKEYTDAVLAVLRHVTRREREAIRRESTAISKTIWKTSWSWITRRSWPRSGHSLPWATLERWAGH